MRPYINFFNLRLPMYGIFVGLGLICAFLAVLKKSESQNIQKEDCLYCSLYAIIGLIIGGKLAYLLTISSYLIKDLKSILNYRAFNQLMSGGYVFYGGMFGVILMIFIYSKQFKISFLDLLDCLGLGFPLAYGIGRIGCFMAGCCYGVPSEFGVEFNNSEVAPHGIKFFPIQLLDSAISIVFFLILFFLISKVKSRGIIISSYLVFYSIERFVLEFFRYDDIRGYFLSLSTSQWISLIVFPIGCVLLIKILNKNTKRG